MALDTKYVKKYRSTRNHSALQAREKISLSVLSVFQLLKKLALTNLLFQKVLS